jgi:hypothetical protein
MTRSELFAAIDADEAVVIRASPLIRSEHSLSIKLARVFISHGRVGALRGSNPAVRRLHPNCPFLSAKLCLIPPFSP